MDKSTAKNQHGFEDSTSRSLIARLQQNDAPAWKELVSLYSPLIFYWCRRLGLADQDCNDVTQEVFRSVVGNIASFQKQRDSDTFRGWLRTVTRNKVIDFFRRNEKQTSAAGGSTAYGRMAQMPDADDVFLQQDEEELRQEHALFMRAIDLIRDDFTDKTWNAFWEVVVNGLSAPEAGKRLGMKSGAVRVAKSRVIKRLRLQLGDELDTVPQKDIV